MSLINRLFNSKKVQCPRCLGKGEVDWDDIKRLKKELKWIPGPCAYCNGKGKVDTELLFKVAVDTTYLTNDLSIEERKSLINKDRNALERARYHEIQTDSFIAEVKYLYFTGRLTSNKIADFYLLHQEQHGMKADEKEELLDYIERIIKHDQE